jgi:hypothetical protein
MIDQGVDITYEIPYNEGCSVDKSIDAKLTAVNQLAAHCQLRSFKIRHRCRRQPREGPRCGPAFGRIVYLHDKTVNQCKTHTNSQFAGGRQLQLRLSDRRSDIAG